MYICFVLGLLARRRVKNGFSSGTHQLLTYAFFASNLVLLCFLCWNPQIQYFNWPISQVKDLMPAEKLGLGLWI